ncbi:MAG: hypothetical protein ACRDTN_10115 [Mycobacterium sp.]
MEDPDQMLPFLRSRDRCELMARIMPARRSVLPAPTAEDRPAAAL